MQVSVIICTYNRAGSMGRVLDSFRRIVVPEGTRWELLLVDNNSKDHTKEVINDFVAHSGVPARYLFEEKQGLSNARNRGILAAQGEIIAFTDDDVSVDPNWLANILREFERTDASCVGGKILPVWEKHPPGWLRGDLRAALALLDLGNDRFRLDAPTIWGANLIVRTSMFRKYGLFDLGLGHNEGKLYGGEETKFLSRLLEGGEQVYYCPEILVHHYIPASRTRKAYFRKWFFDKGELTANQLGAYPHRNLMGIPFYIIASTVKEFLRYIGDQAIFASTAFRKQLLVVYYMGLIRGRLKYRNAHLPMSTS